MMICWKRVNELRSEVGSDAFEEVIEIFLEEVEETVTRLKTSPDPNTLEAELHFLKGSALNIGFDKFAELCGKGEMDARCSDFSSVNIEDVLKSYQNSKLEFITNL